VTLIAFICVLKPVRLRKIFPTEKHTFFSLKVFDLRFSQNFYFKTVSGPESELFSDSVKIYGFVRIRIHNTVPDAMFKSPSLHRFVLRFDKIKNGQ
jgi:hypothetical protein